MWTKVSQYLAVMLISMVKFGAGPISAKAFQLTAIETMISMVAGMMVTVVVLTTLFGDIFYNWLKKTFFKNRKVFSEKSRRIVTVWNKYGLIGIAFLTPVLFSPIGGTLIAVSFGEHKQKIILYMLASAVFWAPVTYYLLETMIGLFHKLV